MDLQNSTQLIQLLKELSDVNSEHSCNCSLQDLLYYIQGYGTDIETSEQNSLTQYSEYNLSKKLLLYIPPVLLVIGTIGNLMAFIVLQAHGSKLSTYSYLSVLAVMDLLVLYVGLLRLWVAELTGMDIMHYSDWLCKFVVFFGYVCSDSSVWLIIVVTTERYIAVNYPLRAAIMCKVKNARIIMFIPVCVLLAVNAHFFWTVSLNLFNGQMKCIAKPAFKYLVNSVWPWVDTALYSFCPFLIITVLNYFIVKQVIAAKRRREKYLQQKKRKILCKRNKSVEANRRLTWMLLAVSFSFLLTTLPMNIILIVTEFLNNTPNFDLRKTAIFMLAKNVSELLMYANHSINFFLYCATGKKFRKTLMQVLSKRSCFSGKNTNRSPGIVRDRYTIKLSSFCSDKLSQSRPKSI